MLRQIGIRNYKGISNAIEMRNLGKINVVCGKNNSGKTSILEAIESKKNVGYAITEEALPKFEKWFQSQAAQFSGPRPEDSMAWFELPPFVVPLAIRVFDRSLTILAA